MKSIEADFSYALLMLYCEQFTFAGPVSPHPNPPSPPKARNVVVGSCFYVSIVYLSVTRRLLKTCSIYRKRLVQQFYTKLLEQ